MIDADLKKNYCILFYYRNAGRRVVGGGRVRRAGVLRRDWSTRVRHRASAASSPGDVTGVHNDGR